MNFWLSIANFVWCFYANLSNFNLDQSAPINILFFLLLKSILCNNNCIFNLIHFFVQIKKKQWMRLNLQRMAIELKKVADLSSECKKIATKAKSL